MIVLNLFARKKADVSLETLRDYWLGERFEMERPLLKKLGVRKYTACETQHDDPCHHALMDLYSTPNDVYDFANHLAINDIQDFKKGMADPEVQAAIKAIAAKDADYIDGSRSNAWMTVTHPVILPRKAHVATWDNSFMKMYYVGQRRPEFTTPEAQLHWIACHGGMAAQFREMLPFDQYVQCHALESSLMKQYKELIGFNEDDERYIGHAELWIERRVLPTVAGPDMENMVGMLLEDISLFIDVPNSRVMSGKEYVLHEEQVITRPLPVLKSGE